MNVFNQEQYSKLIHEASKKISTLQHAVDRLREPIAIVGMGCRFPKAGNIHEYWTLLSEGIDGIQDRPAFHSYIDPYYDEDLTKRDVIYTKKGGFLDQHPASFDAEFFRISALEASSMDPQHRLVLEVTWEALENAGIPPSNLAGSNTGVFIGICSNDYAWKLVKKNTREIDIYLGSGNAYSPVAGRLSYLLDIHGPSLAIDTACSSSLTSTHVAVNSLRSGECDIAIVGGIQRYLSPEYWMNLCKSRILSPDGQCRSFSDDANGYVRGEGCGVVILKRLSQAKKDNNMIYAVIAGSSTRQDGKTSGLTVPNGAAQQDAIKKALENAGLTTKDIDYIEAHGTGTPIGDPIEMNALANLFKKRDNTLFVGTVKSNIGHLEGSAGIAGLIKVVLALRNKQIPKNLHFSAPSAKISWESMPIKVVTELTDWTVAPNKKRTAGVSSFGFEGVNTHIILQEQLCDDAVSRQLVDIKSFTVTLSAKSQTALDAMIKDYISYIDKHPDLDIRDIAFTTNCGREHYVHRLAIVCSSLDKLLIELKSALSKKYSPEYFRSDEIKKNAVDKNKDKGVAFLCTGQGSQYVNMGYELYLNQPIFRKTMEMCNELILDKKLLDHSLLDIIYTDSNSSKLQMTSYTQPSLFIIEYSLSKLLMELGVEPAVVLGHSVGEYVAACLAGIFSLENALDLVVNRGKLMQALPENGAMMVLNINEDKVRELIKNNPLVSIAAVNGLNNTVLSGERSELNKVIAILTQEKGVYAIPLHVSHAFHSPLMKPMLDDFKIIAKKVDYKTPVIPFISNITGRNEIIKPTNADYWCEHILSPVRFYDSMLELEKYASMVLEVGPDSTLLGISKRYTSNIYKIAAPVMRKNQNDWHSLMLSLAPLYSNSIDIKWNKFYQEYNHSPVLLPTYPWQRNHYWID